jgi:hypothetical protein
VENVCHCAYQLQLLSQKLLCFFCHWHVWLFAHLLCRFLFFLDLLVAMGVLANIAHVFEKVLFFFEVLDNLDFGFAVFSEQDECPAQ